MIDDQKGRTEISIAEHGEAILPLEVIRADGTFDLYDDVQARFEIAYKRKTKRLVIRAGGWVGYLPLNEKYALQISTRVPVNNLEKIVLRSKDIAIDILQRHTRSYSRSVSKPRKVHDVIAEQFLNSLDLIWKQGLAKSYIRQDKVSSTPFGRLDAYRTALQTERAGRPMARFSYFHRSVDFGPNRLLKLAVDQLLRSYSSLQNESSSRLRRLHDANRRFLSVQVSNIEYFSSKPLEIYLSQVPSHRSAYLSALKLADLIRSSFGVLIRALGDTAGLPVMLANMADIFESYTRETLKRFCGDAEPYSVLDGNVSGKVGAKTHLFGEFDLKCNNPTATPDIVIKRGKKVELVIDVKYKPPKEIPDRSDINQIVCYAARFECNKVMIVYPKAIRNGEHVRLIGSIGSTQVYRAHLDLNAVDLNLEENQFTFSVFDQFD